MSVKTKRQTVTVYMMGGFGAMRTFGAFKTLRTVARKRYDGSAFGQVVDRQVVDVVPDRKRNAVSLSGETAQPMIVAILGQHPEPPNDMIDLGNGCSKTKYACFDPRYRAEFNAWMNAYLLTVPAHDVIVDERFDKSETPPVED